MLSVTWVSGSPIDMKVPQLSFRSRRAREESASSSRQSRFLVATLLGMTELLHRVARSTGFVRDFRRRVAKPRPDGVSGNLQFLLKTNKKQIPHADYSKVFKWRSAPRSGSLRLRSLRLCSGTPSRVEA